MQFALQSTQNFLTVQPITLSMTCVGAVTAAFTIVRFRVKPSGAIVHMQLDDDLDGSVSEQKDTKLFFGVAQRTGTVGQEIPIVVSGRTQLAVRGKTTAGTDTAVTTSTGIGLYNQNNFYWTTGAVPAEGERILALGLGETEGETIVASGAATTVYVLFDGIQSFGPKYIR